MTKTISNYINLAYSLLEQVRKLTCRADILHGEDYYNFISATLDRIINLRIKALICYYSLLINLKAV